MTVALNVDAVRAGDRGTFGELYRQHARMLYGYLLSQLRDHGLAEDLTNETFVRAIRGAHRLRDSTAEIRPWLITIARNLHLDHAKSARSRLEVTCEHQPDLERAPDPAALSIQSAERAELWAALAELSADQRRCLTLRFLCGCTVAETASIMGRDAGAVRALQYRGARKLAEIIRARPRSMLSAGPATRGRH